MVGIALGRDRAGVHLSLVAPQAFCSNLSGKQQFLHNLEAGALKDMLIIHISNVSQEPGDIQAPGGMKFP